MGKKRYRSIYDALDDVLMGCMDTSHVKAAKERAEEMKRQRQAQQKKKYVTLEQALDPNADRLLKLQRIIDDPAAAPGEKENARRLIEKIKAKGVK